MRNLRMDRAALLLRQEPQTSVAEIAGRVGYDSASKFAAVFKEAKGKTPLEYRRGGREMFSSKRDRTGAPERTGGKYLSIIVVGSASDLQSFFFCARGGPIL